MGAKSENGLVLSLALTVLVMFVEAAGALWSGSLSLMSDAGHALTDALSLGLALIAARISQRPTDSRASYGYGRVAVLAAVINGVALFGVSGSIFVEAVHRFGAPPAVRLDVMLPVAVFGLVANFIMLGALRHDHRDLNLRSAWLHVLGDTLSSVGVVVAGAIIALTGWEIADPVVSVMIAAVIFTGGVRVLRDAAYVLLDLVPPGIDMQGIARLICSVDDVRDVHDLHVRTGGHGRIEVSAHVVVDDRMLSDAGRIRRAIEERLAAHTACHVTLQMEAAPCDPEGRTLYCKQCNP